MRQGRSLRAALGLASLVLFPVIAGAAVVPGKDQRVGTRAWPAASAPLPCEQAVQDLTLAPLQSHAFQDTTSGASSVDAYGCRPAWPELGPEHIYVLTASEPLILDAWLLDNDPDHDLVVLSDCESDSCLAQANTEISAQLDAGQTIYLVVDGYQVLDDDGNVVGGAAGPYELRLETRAVGIPEQVCAPGGAEPVDVPAALSEPLAGNLFEAANLVSIYDCSELAVQGGEAWFALTVAAADTDTVGIGYQQHLALSLEATPEAASLDLALWLFDGCGPDAECLAFADGANAGGAETLEWANTGAATRTVYLAVDCFVPPEQELAGGFDLLVDAVVPVRRMSLQQLRRVFEDAEVR